MAWRRLLAAVEDMATSPEPIQDRLAGAIHDRLLVLMPENFPEALMADFRALKEDLPPVNAPDQSRPARLGSMLSDDEAAGLARRILDLFKHLDLHSREVADPDIDPRS